MGKGVLKNTLPRGLMIAFLVLSILAVNPYVFGRRAGYPISAINRATLTMLLALDIIGVLSIGLIAARWDLVEHWLATAWRTCRKTLPELLQIKAAAPCIVFSYGYFVSVASYIGSEHSAPIALAVMAWPALCSGVVLSMALRRMAMGWGGWSLLAVLYTLSMAVNLLALSNGGGQLSYRMLGWLSVESIIMFMRPGLLLVLPGLLIGYLFVAWWHRRFKPVSARRVTITLLAGLVLGLVNPIAETILALAVVQSAEGRLATRIAIVSLDEVRDPLVQLAGQVVKKCCLGTTKPGLASYAAQVVKVRNLPGPPRLIANPPKRIIVIFVESFSLNYSKRYNPALPTTLTPQLDALVSNATARELRIWTISSPTTPGLETHFCSVPNPDLAEDADYDCSVVRKLRAAGWQTMMFESPPEDYDNGRRRLAEIGFADLRGSAYQQAHGNAEFVKQWGVFDRITMASIAQYVVAHPDRKLFVAGLTIDTHFPIGRTDYGQLTYPEAPGWIAQDPAARLLRSVYRADYDIGNFVGALRKIDNLKDTVIIITGDHSLPPFPGVDNRLGLARTRFEELPFIVIGQKLPAVYPSPTDSQLETAPTIAHLAMIAPDRRWWGRSLFQAPQGESALYRYDDDGARALDAHARKFTAGVGDDIVKLLRTYPN